ncbi:MAG: HIT domain-containing protein [Planctomycetota bacterium]|nr:HIT domain-containing protein [Planctomycetota bacterium]
MSADTLWAPWRLDYIKNPDRKPDAAAKGCFLCDYRDNSGNDAENYVVSRGQTMFVVLNRFPYNNCLLLVAPLAHKQSLDELTENEMLESVEQIRQMIGVLKATLNAEGFNVGLNLGHVAGAGLPGHLHWHVVPRWNGDSNFMTVVSDTNVIPQSLQTLYDLLRQAIDDAKV